MAADFRKAFEHRAISAGTVEDAYRHTPSFMSVHGGGARGTDDMRFPLFRLGRTGTPAFRRRSRKMLAVAVPLARDDGLTAPPAAPPPTHGGDVDYTAVIGRHAERFLAPSDMTVVTPRKKVLLIGTCFFDHWKTVEIEKRLEVSSDWFALGAPNEIPDDVMKSATDYDFQVIHAPLYTAIPDEYLAIAPDDHAGFQRAFERGKSLVELYIDAMLKFNKRYGTETYVCNFVSPQAGLHGRLAPRYDLSNVLFFTEEINRHLARFLSNYRNAHYVDLDAVCASEGKRFSRDDFYWQSNHGGSVTDAEAPLDAARLRVTPSAKALYRSDEKPFIHAAWREIIAMHRTLHATDLVKMVVVDLDDTLWRGLVGEGEGDANGWPGGLCEALLHLKHRGILLAIISKNDETVVRDNWRRILGSRISMDDFAVVRINYDPKPINMGRILEAVKLLPRSTVFIDDNPVERDAMQSAYPDIRVLGDVPAYLKRILMWSSETQVGSLSAESAQRTTMIQAQIERDVARRAMSRDDFLDGLGLTMTVAAIRGVEDRRFARAVELVNKTNQFNTSGLKLTPSTAADHFRRGGVLYVFSAADKHTTYGLVGVLVCAEASIEQFVMSCRVAGLDVEKGAMAIVLSHLAETWPVSRARLIHTDVNLLCRNVFADAGFERDGEDGWVRDLTTGAPVAPPHLAIAVEL